MKDPIKTIGQIIDDTAKRDAIHIAIMPAVVGKGGVHRGEHVGLVYGTTNTIVSKQPEYGLTSIGIVDPFLTTYRVGEGKIVWVFLHPNSVSGMRHEWTHPLIDNLALPASESERWLRKFADKWNFDYDHMIQFAQSDDGYVVARGIDLHDASELCPGDEELFWEHVETLTGKQFNRKHRQNFVWSCSC